MPIMGQSATVRLPATPTTCCWCVQNTFLGHTACT
jgi:hypothetical protein